MGYTAVDGFNGVFSMRDSEFLFQTLGLLLTKGPISAQEVYDAIGRNPKNMGSISAIAVRLPIEYLMETRADGRLYVTEEGRQLYRNFEKIGRLHKI